MSPPVAVNGCVGQSEVVAAGEEEPRPKYNKHITSALVQGVLIGQEPA